MSRSARCNFLKTVTYIDHCCQKKKKGDPGATWLRPEKHVDNDLSHIGAHPRSPASGLKQSFPCPVSFRAYFRLQATFPRRPAILQYCSAFFAPRFESCGEELGERRIYSKVCPLIGPLVACTSLACLNRAIVIPACQL
jgi:hypothetical protein